MNLAELQAEMDSHKSWFAGQTAIMAAKMALDPLSEWLIDSLDCGALLELVAKAQVMRAELEECHPLKAKLKAFIALAESHLGHYETEVDGIKAEAVDYGTLKLSARGLTLATFPMTADWRQAAQKLGGLMGDKQARVIPQMIEIIEVHGGHLSR